VTHFTARAAAMLALTVVIMPVCPFVRPSVRHTRVLCDKNKQWAADILIPRHHSMHVSAVVTAIDIMNINKRRLYSTVVYVVSE